MNARIRDVFNGDITALSSIRVPGRILLVDFWNTRCTRCPSALSKMDELAKKFSKCASFVACALSVDSSESALSDVTDLVTDLPNLKHFYMEFETKESVKAELGFNTLPFAVVYGTDGQVLLKGNPLEDGFDHGVTRILSTQ